jgi:hypothetical protein
LGRERDPLGLVRIIEELLEWKSSGFGLENRIDGSRDLFLLWGKKYYKHKKGLADYATPSFRK